MPEMEIVGDIGLSSYGSEYPIPGSDYIDSPGNIAQSSDFSAAAGAVVAGGVLTVEAPIIVPLVITAALAMKIYSQKELLQKQTKETFNLLRKMAGPPGFTYMLVVNKSGNYQNVRGTQITLKAGDIWKYGETTSSERYNASEMRGMVPGGVTLIPLFYGSQLEIKIAEKGAIYSYFSLHGYLPPGNKVFR